MNQCEINQSWSESAPNYDSIIHDELKSFRVAAWQEQILSHFPAGRPLQILDIGCGPGFFSIILSAMGHDVTGIDGADRTFRCGYSADGRQLPRFPGRHV